ncbi:MAG: AI-2E family transporter [Lachnospiraceae bacterium]|nr:AI-2E family transporter [Lachnospiraceae bacterium]
MDKFKKILEKRWAAYTIAACTAVLLYMILSNIGNIFGGVVSVFGFVSTILWGLVIAYILNPLVEFIKRFFKKYIKSETVVHNISVCVSIIVVLAVFFVLVFAFIPQILGSIQLLLKNMDSYASTLKNLLRELNDMAAKYKIDLSGLTDVSDKLLGTITSKLSANLSNIVNVSINLGTTIFNILISFILAVYFLIDRVSMTEGARRFFHLILSDAKYASLAEFWRRCNKILVKYISGSIIEGLMVGVANAVFMVVMGMPYTVIVSVVVGLTNLAPTFGPIVGGVIGAFILALVNPWYALWFIIFTIVLQTIDGYIVKPKFFGETLGVSGVWILIMIIVLGKLMGVVGILLAIPVAAILDFIYDDILMKHEKKVAERERERKKNAKKSADNENVAKNDDSDNVEPTDAVSIPAEINESKTDEFF